MDFKIEYYTIYSVGDNINLTMSDEAVKLVQNTVVKELLQEAKKTNHIIEVDETSFMVRDKMNQKVIFRGIKIRNNCWGITF